MRSEVQSDQKLLALGIVRKWSSAYHGFIERILLPGSPVIAFVGDIKTEIS